MCQYCEEPFDNLPVDGLCNIPIQIVSIASYPWYVSDDCESPASKWATVEHWDDGASHYIWFCPICGRELPQD